MKRSVAPYSAYRAYLCAHYLILAFRSRVIRRTRYDGRTLWQSIRADLAFARAVLNGRSL